MFGAALTFGIESSRAAHEAGAATGIVNVGVTRADDFVSLKINARLGEVQFPVWSTVKNEISEKLRFVCACIANNFFSISYWLLLLQIMPRVLHMGSLSIPALQWQHFQKKKNRSLLFQSITFSRESNLRHYVWDMDFFIVILIANLSWSSLVLLTFHFVFAFSSLWFL